MCAILPNMKRLVNISEAAKALGVSITTLRRWDASGRLAAERTAGGHRRYDLAKLKPEMFRALDRQKCASQGWTFEDIKGLKKLLEAIIDGQVNVDVVILNQGEDTTEEA